MTRTRHGGQDLELGAGFPRLGHHLRTTDVLEWSCPGRPAYGDRAASGSPGVGGAEGRQLCPFVPLELGGGAL